MAAKAKTTRRKQVTLDIGVLNAVEGLARDTSVSVDALTEDALRDLLKKHRRPISFKDALRDSVRTLPANDREPKRPRAKA